MVKEEIMILDYGNMLGKMTELFAPKIRFRHIYEDEKLFSNRHIYLINNYIETIGLIDNSITYKGKEIVENLKTMIIFLKNNLTGKESDYKHLSGERYEE